MGSIVSIELDWHEGLFVETSAAPPAILHTPGHGSMRAFDTPVGVWFDAKCCLCEWAYEMRAGMAEPLVRDKGQSVSYGYRTPDIEGMLGWCGYHRSSFTHKRAVENFKRLKGQEKKGQG